MIARCVQQEGARHKRNLKCGFLASFGNHAQSARTCAWLQSAAHLMLAPYVQQGVARHKGYLKRGFLAGIGQRAQSARTRV